MKKTVKESKIHRVTRDKISGIKGDIVVYITANNGKEKQVSTGTCEHFILKTYYVVDKGVLYA